MTLFDFFRQDWKDKWIKEACEGAPDWTKFDGAGQEDFRYIIERLRKKGREKMCEDITLLMKVSKIYGW